MVELRLPIVNRSGHYIFYEEALANGLIWHTFFRAAEHREKSQKTP